MLNPKKKYTKEVYFELLDNKGTESEKDESEASYDPVFTNESIQADRVTKREIELMAELERLCDVEA